MKTINEVLALFPGTTEAQWKQHANGKGWIFETAYAGLSTFIEGIVYGDARVSGNARVYGDAQVSGNAQVYGDAWVYGNAWVSGDTWVYGNAQVSGNAWVSGDTWVSSPLYIQGTRHALTLCSFTEIAIGCHVHSIAFWQKEGRKIGNKEGYSIAEINEYIQYITLFAAAAKALSKAANKLG